MFVTESLGAATRTVLENARTLIVWLVRARGGCCMHACYMRVATSLLHRSVRSRARAGCAPPTERSNNQPQAALGLYYGHVGGDGSLGEPWDSWSWLQARTHACISYAQTHASMHFQALQLLLLAHSLTARVSRPSLLSDMLHQLHAGRGLCRVCRWRILVRPRPQGGRGQINRCWRGAQGRALETHARVDCAWR